MDLLINLPVALGLPMGAIAVSLAGGCYAGKAEAQSGAILIAIGVKIPLQHVRGG
ncbi:MAG TPA: hypothetical protein VF451_03410 [Acidobacteriota bacterium]